MKLTTNQTKEFVVSLIVDGFIRNDGRIFRADDCVRACYNKLLEYVRLEVSEEFTTYPIWCWYKIESAIKNDGIEIVLKVPDNIVKLIDYYDWGGGVLYYAECLESDPDNEEYLTAYNSNFYNCIDEKKLRGDIQAIIPYIKWEWVENKEELKSILSFT